jgi:lantibiotic modifying enzyme
MNWQAALVSIAVLLSMRQPPSGDVGRDKAKEPMGPIAHDHRKAALQAARWIRSTAMPTENGSMWPAIPGDLKSIGPELYHGVSGIVLFWLEAYRSTKDESFLRDARRGADYLLASISAQKEAGLYEGLAGIGFALQETYKVTGLEPYRDGAKRCVQWFAEHAKKFGQGVEWNESTDIIAGSAGVGLFLLYAARELNDDAARDLAVAAGRRLIELGRPTAGGLKWAMTPQFSRLMPNFSHGTAGVAYYLTALFMETKDKEFLNSALAGANYLKSIANSEGQGFLVFHHEPGGEDLFYLGWCHGPVGTARLFYRLHQATGNREWLDFAERSARAIMASGIPDKRTPGFWNNAGQCCGTAGVAEFFLDLHRVTHNPKYLAFSRRMTDDLLARATLDDQGLRWNQAEHRVQPNLLMAQTGYMQGAAGIGMWLLHLDRFERGQKDRIALPDCPF